MECEYIYGGQKLKYQQLVEQIQNIDLEGALSIVYKLDQDDIYNSIIKLKKEYQFKQWEKSQYRGIDETPSIDVGDDMSIQQFIDSAYFMVNGEPPMFQMVFEDYLKHRKQVLIESKKMNESEAERYISLMKDRWEIIAKDAYNLHKILVSAKSKNDTNSYIDLAANVKDTAFENIIQTVHEASSDIIKQVFLRNGSDKINGGNKGKLIKNVNLTAEIKGLDEKLVGHIDYLVVRDNGEIEIFNIKSSAESFSDWDSVKIEKYKYQMAFLKKILEYNGIPVKNIRMNIIPVQMVYNDTYDSVVDLRVSNAIPLDFADMQYALSKYDKIADQFVISNVTVDEVEGTDILKLHNQLQKIFPGSNIDTYGIKETAKSWVDRYWKQLRPTPLDEGGWEITIPGDTKPIKISNPKYGSKNEQIVQIVENRLNDLSKNVQNEMGINRIISDIQNAYQHSGVYSPSGEYGFYLQEQFNKYFADKQVKDDGTFDYTWKLVSNDILKEAGILIFQNKYTDQIDIITLTNYDITQQYKFKGRNNILGYYIPDRNDYGFSLKSDYGNIEAIRTMVIVNEVLPKLKGQFKLGDLKVLGVSHQISGKKGRIFDLSRLTPEFDTILQVVNSNTKAAIDNNFKKLEIKYVDSADLLLQAWNEIITNPQEENLSEIKNLDKYIFSKTLPDGTSVEGLLQAQTVEAKIEKLELLIDKLKHLALTRGIKLGDTETLAKLSESKHNNLNVAIAKLYVLATKTLNQYFGDLSLENEKFSSLEEYALKMSSSSNSNLRRVSYMFTQTIDKIAGDMVNKYTPIRQIFMQFYEDAGYTKTQNALIGNQAAIYESLYELDLQGNRTMQFKNPYDEFNDLKDYERKFLKKILYEFYKIRCQVCGIPMEITSSEDPKLKNKLPDKYLNAPLERASEATRRVNMKDGFKQFGKRVWRAITKPKEFFEEMNGLLDKEEIRKREDDIKNLQAYNPFKNSELSINVRNNYINEKGVDYFEYNVENLFIDYMEKQIQAEEYNKLLTRVKGIELDLLLRAKVEDDTEDLDHTIKAIDDFMSINVFNKSIMEEHSQKLEARLAPLRRAVSTLYVAGNVAGMVRDIFQGVLENISHALIKFKTDIDTKDVVFGYKEVITEGVGNLMTMTKLNQFNLKYRFSNLDVARISEGQKTGRGGILNGENWAYATLRSPDYLNRMVLFVARMHHDGCYDAYKLNAEKRLKYDWRLDKRFDLFAKGEEGKKQNLEKYNQQKSLYYSLIRQFNLEGYRKDDGEQLNYSDPLPDAYTLQEIQTFKHFSDNIYGSYNQSTKSKYEHIAIGRNFLFFSTWMNGIVDVYFKNTQVSQSELQQKQEVDYNGNPLFFNDDGTTTDVDTGVPVIKGVPVMVQGIFKTLSTIRKTLYHSGLDENGNWSFSQGWNAVKTDVLSDESERKNLLRLLRDILVSFMLTAAIKMVLDPAYKDHKKQAKGEELIQNGMIELLYKSSRSCYDTFLGPFAVLEYLGNQTNPAAYRVQSKIFTDLGSYIFGDKTFGEIIMNSQALPRSFKDTYHIWVRDTKSTTEE